MSIITNIERIEKMHSMILTKRTGSPDDFARKLGLSRSMMYYWIKDLKELGAPIAYCRSRNSFTYIYPVDFIVKFEEQLPNNHLNNSRELVFLEGKL